ncbi:MAG TPA: hypothetical protein VKV21_15470 [Solirubrobacteraceae bacterium]|nr:hypothetical protein [Solirubrobacteraceae bacterium]
MKLRRSLPLTGVSLAAGLSFAATALAAGAALPVRGHAAGAPRPLLTHVTDSAPPVSVRVEGATRTLLDARAVTAPSSGSITKGGTPAGACPADSAAGALGRATHGRWNGTYYKGLGIEVTTILGRRLDARRSYWELFVDDRTATKGICETKLRRGESLLFAAVPTKGRPELPIVVRAPRTARIGRPFLVRAFVYTGKGNATRAVRGLRADWRTAGHLRVSDARTGRPGELRVTFHGAGSPRATLVVSAKGEIRSAPATIRVVR